MTRLGWAVVAIVAGLLGGFAVVRLPLTGEDGWVLAVTACGLACLAADAIGARRRSCSGR